jgi:hypothetical protein
MSVDACDPDTGDTASVCMGRGMRKKKLAPKLRQDLLPDGPAPLPPPREPPPPEDSELCGPRRFVQIRPNLRLVLNEMVRTAGNAFGVSRLYFGRPAHIPDAHHGGMPDHVITQDRHAMVVSPSSVWSAIWPYLNLSAWRLGSWFWGGGDTKSKAAFKDLVKNVLLAQDFNLRELEGVQWDRIDEKLASNVGDQPYGGEGWQNSTLMIEIPTGVKRKVGGGHDTWPD